MIQKDDAIGPGTTTYRADGSAHDAADLVTDEQTALVKEHKMSDRELLEAALAAGPGEKAPDEFVWILAGGHRVGWFTGDGLGARCPDGSVCHVD